MARKQVQSLSMPEESVPQQEQEKTWQEILAEIGQTLDDVIAKVKPLFKQHERCAFLSDYATAAKEQVNKILKK